MIDVSAKVCSKCCIYKDFSEFEKHLRCKYGFHSICKTCKNPKKVKNKTHKKCNECNIEKLPKDFQTCKGGYLGVRGVCKLCEKEVKRINHNEGISIDDIKNNIEFKFCPSCGNNLSSDNFNIDRHTKLGLSTYCKNCSCKKYTEYKICKKCSIKKHQSDYTSNQSYICSDCKRLKQKKDSKKHRDKNKLSYNTKNLIWQSFKRACKGTYKKSDRTENILGCTIQEFIKHLQSLFTEGMTLENNGQCEECWHIDHKIPLATAETEEDIIKLCHYTNLQPLWSRENIIKGSKIN